MFPKGIYGILGEAFSRGRSNPETAELMVKGGIDIIQYREKSHEKDRGVMLEECRTIRKITEKAGVLFIVNDFLDIALLSGADGVHVGQEDLPVAAVKERFPSLVVGCSAHNPEEIDRAVKDGADYIGTGPVFPTETKKNTRDVLGLDFLDYVAARKDIPFTAIGGIKRENLKQVVLHGADTVCLVSDIVGAGDIVERVRELKGLYLEALEERS